MCLILFLLMESNYFLLKKNFFLCLSKGYVKPILKAIFKIGIREEMFVNWMGIDNINSTHDANNSSLYSFSLNKIYLY